MNAIKLVKKAYKLFNDPYWRAKQYYTSYYKDIPLDEHAILLESEHGKKLDGNIFYILRYLATSEKYSDYKLYLCSMGRHMRKFRQFLEDHGISERVNIVMLATDEYMRLLASAKYLINDTSFGHYFVKRDGQVYINTWHGTPLKALGKSDVSGYNSIGNVQSNFLKSDFLLYPNEYTRDIMIRDYMLENLSNGKVVLSGYPRNEIFYDKAAYSSVREAIGISDKRIYVYMPTYRGSVGKGKTSKSTAYLVYYLYELDRELNDNEILYVNLHPLATDGVDFNDFKHIRTFPKEYEVYEFLNAADILITDYSSVFFDFAVTGRKTVLFTYDEAEYLATRGMYLDISELPFPRVYDVSSLLREVRCEKNYDDREFLRRFCSYESPDASAKLCDATILGEESGAIIRPVPSNNKENVLIYAGNLAGNGITTSLRSLLSTVDRTERNYIITFKADNVYANKENIKSFPEDVAYIPIPADFNLNIRDRVFRKIFKENKIKAKRYAKSLKGSISLSLKQFYGDAKIDHVIQFNGYENEVIINFAAFPCNKIIFVHSDMLSEIKTRSNHRLDVLKYAYNAYDHVAVVTDDIMSTTRKIAGDKANLSVVKNVIDNKAVLEKGNIPLDEPDYQSCTVEFDRLCEILDSDAPKFINIGRFAPEKGQERLIDAFARFREHTPDSYLLIIGGNSFKNHYDIIKSKVDSMGLSDHVILIMKTPNPYRILNKCDYFVLSSFYEGFGLVLAEADILGKPVISTDITGPRLFMQANGGTLVENSEDGLYKGLCLMAEGMVKPMGVDYDKYNEEIKLQFDALFKND